MPTSTTATVSAVATITAITQNAASPVATPATNGAPNVGAPSNGAPPNGGDCANSATDGLASATGAYTLDGGTATETDQTYTATNADESGVYVINGGTLTLVNPTVTKNGETSSADYSSFYGLNAAVLATSGSTDQRYRRHDHSQRRRREWRVCHGRGSSVSLTKTTIKAYGRRRSRCHGHAGRRADVDGG